MDLRFYWSVFRRRLAYFLSAATIIGALAVAVAATLPPSYVSQMRLLVELPEIEDPAGNPVSPFDQLQLLETRLLTRANLLDIARKVMALPEQNELTPDQIVQSMLARTNISIDRNTPLMTITFEAGDGAKAAGVLNEYLTLIQQEDVESRTGRAANTLEFFDQEVSRLNAGLAERSAQILAFKNDNADALPESLDFRLNQQKLLQERLATQERELDSLESQRERLVAVFQETGEVPTAQDTQLTPDQLELESLRKELSNAQVIYSESHPRVVLLQARVDRLAERVSQQPQPSPVDVEPATDPAAALLEVQLADIEARIEGLKQLIETTTLQLDEVGDTIARTPANAIRLDELQLDYENIQQQYNLAVDRLSRASTTERIIVMAKGQRVSVIEPPTTPNKPTKPKRALIAGGGMSFGILLGLALVVLREFLDKSVRRAKDLERGLTITPLAMLPYTPTPGETLRRRLRKLILVLAIVIGIPAAIYALHVYYLPLDLFAEKIMDRLGIR